MKCKECNFQNTTNAKFCTNCGNQLSNTDSSRHRVKTKNRKNKTHQKQKNDFSSNIKNVKNILFSTKGVWLSAVIIVGLFITITIIDSGLKNVNRGNDRIIDNRSNNPFVEAKVMEIASKFVCGCGSCGEEALEICTCNYAVKERQFIRDYLESNNSEDIVIRAVINKYGGYKLEHGNETLSQNQFGLNSNNLSINPSNVIQLVDSNKINFTNDISLATFSDRETIYTKFECPCGQCGIKELAECTCTHVNGAIEVKKFIDMKISQNKFSADQIVEFVAENYGGLK